MATLQKITLSAYKNLLSNGFYKVGYLRKDAETVAQIIESKNFEVLDVAKNDLFKAEFKSKHMVHVNDTNPNDTSRVREDFGAGESYYTVTHNDMMYVLHDYKWDNPNISIKAVIQ